MAVLRRLASIRLPRELSLALLLAFVHGLLYVFIVPPWRHYDEPAHFEYAALISKHGRVPREDALDVDLRTAISASLERTGFYRALGRYPDVVTANGDRIPSLGYSQLPDPPAYYMLASVPINLLRNYPIEWQVRAARLVSLGLLMLTVVCGWGTAAALTRAGHPLRWMLPCALALLPAFVDVMTAVNNDAATVASVSAFVWAAVWLLNPKQDRSWTATGLGSLLVAALAVGSFLVKNSAAIALPVAGMAILFSLCRGRLRPIAWGVLVAGVLAVVTFLFTLDDAALWIRGTGSETISATRCETDVCGASPVGSHAIALEALRGRPASYVFQLLPSDAVLHVRGRVVTVGAWVWISGASDAGELRAALPTIRVNYAPYEPAQATITSTPTFIAITQTVPVDASQLSIVLPSAVLDGQAHATEDAKITYDGVVVVTGDYSQSGEPIFDDDAASKGVWGNQRVHNWVRNASGEHVWLALRPMAAALIGRISPAWANWTQGIAAVQDWPSFSWYHALTLETLFKTFWAQTGTGNISVGTGFNYLALMFTAIGVVGCVIGLWRNRIHMNWAVVAVMAALFVLAWLPTAIRGMGTSMEYSVWIPVARYAFSAIVPTLLALCVGWLAVFGLISPKVNSTVRGRVLSGCFGVCFTLLAVASLVANASFHGSG